MKNDFIPRRDGDLNTWENNFVSLITAIATALGFTAAEIAALIAKITNHQGKYADSVTAQAAAKAAVTTANEARKETITDVRTFVRRIKVAPGYTNAQGEALKIIGEESTFNPATAQPEVSLSISGENVVIRFNHPREVDGVKLYRMRGDERDFTFLATDTESPYEDNAANLVPGVAEQRSYYAFFFIDDEIVGLQSAIQSISITK